MSPATPREQGAIAACVAHRTGVAPQNPYVGETPLPELFGFLADEWARGFDSEIMKLAAEEEQKTDAG